MELNPNNEITRKAREQWHKIAALILMKMGKTEMEFDLGDVQKLAESNGSIVLDARDNLKFSIRLVGAEEAKEIAKQAGGRASDN